MSSLEILCLRSGVADSLGDSWTVMSSSILDSRTGSGCVMEVRDAARASNVCLASEWLRAQRSTDRFNASRDVGEGGSGEETVLT